MTTTAGVGRSTNQDSRTAGREAAGAALAGLDGPADVVLVFGTGGHAQAALLAGVREVTGEALVTGCSGAGVITRGAADESSYAVAVMAVRSSTMRFGTAWVADLRGHEVERARAIASAAPDDVALVVVFPDGLTGNLSAFVRALDAELPGVAIVGGGAGGDFDLAATHQYDGDDASRDGVSALFVGGAVEVACGVTHGCELVGIEHVVTRAEGGTVFELDGRPAWEVMRAYLDDPDAGFEASLIAFLCLAQALPDGGDAAYGAHVIRVPLGMGEGGALFFPGELREGERVTMARRAPEEVVRRAASSLRELRERRPGRAPALVLQLECTGRGRLLFGHAVTETLLVPVQDELPDVPWIGFYAFGEIGPIGGRARYHNYTQSLCALYDAPGRTER